MKDFFKENFWWLILAIMLIGAIVSPIFNVIWIKKLFLAPFAVLGVYSAFIGFSSICDKFIEDTDNRIKGGLLLLTFVISVIAIGIWIIEW